VPFRAYAARLPRAPSTGCGATGPKTLEWLETTNHIELHDSKPHLDRALERLVPFYAGELAG
jgi:hypothetical protein